LNDYTTHIIVNGRNQGRPYSTRRPLNVPLDLATGNIESLSDLQLRDTISDLQAEQARRLAAVARRTKVAAACGDYDPNQSQHRGGPE
jgi:hypothetical protein